MKNLFLGLAIACLTVACASEKKASVEDSSAPAAVECSTKSDCSEAEKAECASKAKAECSAEAKAECETKKVCPVTGKEIN